MGSFQSVVQSSIVPGELWGGTKSKTGCVHGDEKVYPTAEVYPTVALVPKLPYPVILGQDVPTFPDLIQQARGDNQVSSEGWLQGTVEVPVQEGEHQQLSPQPVGVACNVVTARAQKVKNTLA